MSAVERELGANGGEMKLTEKTIDALEYDPAGKQNQTMWDSSLPGFGVRLHAGGSKSYVVAYRIGRGRSARQRRVVLDDVRRLSLKDAREQAAAALSKARGGEDPFADLYASKEYVRVSELCYRYLRDYAKPYKSPKSYVGDRSIIDNHVLPHLGRKNAVDVTTRDITRVLTLVGESAPVQANRVRALLSKMFNLAEDWGIRPAYSNPVRRTSKFKEKARHVHVTPEQLLALHAELRHHRVTTAAAIKMILYTGGRPGEIIPLRWQPDPAGAEPHVELEARRIYHPQAKTGARVIPLNALALRVLAELPRDGVYCFPSEDGTKPNTGVNKAWVRIRQKAGLPKLRLNDLRHVFATLMNTLEVSTLTAQKVLGHGSAKTTQVYVNPAEQEAHAASQKVGDYLDQLLTAGTAGAKLDALTAN